MQSFDFLEGNAKTDVVGLVFARAQVAEGGLAVEGQTAPTAAADDPATVFFLAKQGILSPGELGIVMIGHDFGQVAVHVAQTPSIWLVTANEGKGFADTVVRLLVGPVVIRIFFPEGLVRDVAVPSYFRG